MDNFIEQIVAKKSEGKDVALRILILVGFSFLAALSFLAMNWFGPYVLIIGAGSVYLMWLLLTNTSVEYEYIVTNNELDIDKISGRRKRKRLVTVKINTAEEWGEYADGAGKTASTTVSAHDCGYRNMWYLLVNHEKFGKTMVLFSPNDAVLFAVNKAMPYSLRKRDIKEKAKTDEEAVEENQGG